jgi:tetratricopeptide (TPR) repeat protein
MSLECPTENALAQAMWTRQSVGLKFDFSKHLNAMANASEARARAEFEAGDYSESVRECWAWLADESFSPRAARTGSFICVSLLQRYDEAIQFAQRGLIANRNDRDLINSNLVALALSGHVKEAAKLLRRIEMFEADRDFAPFVHAARGLVAFRLGNISEGRRFYELAVTSSKESSRPSLAENAVIYWLEQELFAGTISVTEATTVIDNLEQHYSLHANKVNNAPIWRARRPNLDKLVTELSKREDLRRSASERVAPGRIVIGSSLQR